MQSSVLLEPVAVNRCKNSQQQDDINNNSSKSDNLIKDLLLDHTSSSDPFNDMELKTLNDLEELKIVLQEQDKFRIRQQEEVQKSQVNFYLDQQQLRSAGASPALFSTYLNSNTSFGGNCAVDSFGLPKISFYDLDTNNLK